MTDHLTSPLKRKSVFSFFIVRTWVPSHLFFKSDLRFFRMKEDSEHFTPSFNEMNTHKDENATTISLLLSEGDQSSYRRESDKHLASEGRSHVVTDGALPSNSISMQSLPLSNSPTRMALSQIVQ